jgi:uncharacterized protein (DUF952 family)
MSNLILHATSRDRWDASRQTGVHLDPSLDTDGFIHCSTATQVVRVANFLFRGQHGLVLLVIDPSRLKAGLKWEPPVHPGHEKDAPVSDDLFPHIYGPINTDAVTDVVSFEPGPDGLFSLPPSLASTL